MNRRKAFLSVGQLAAFSVVTTKGVIAGDAADEVQGAWDAWKTEFLSFEGRVVDHLQGDASHSEGQGYGMLLAEAFNDSESFEAMRNWTEENLAVRDDPLLAWRWRPDDDLHIADYNNATDGDLFFAWALLRGARRFGVPGLAGRAREIARFLADGAVVADPRDPARTLLLPALEGAMSGQAVTVNLSY